MGQVESEFLKLPV